MAELKTQKEACEANIEEVTKSFTEKQEEQTKANELLVQQKDESIQLLEEQNADLTTAVATAKQEGAHEKRLKEEAEQAVEKSRDEISQILDEQEMKEAELHGRISDLQVITQTPFKQAATAVSVAYCTPLFLCSPHIRMAVSKHDLAASRATCGTYR